MGGAPDYGPGDWVVCVNAKGLVNVKKGYKYVVSALVPPDSFFDGMFVRGEGWAVRLAGVFEPCYEHPEDNAVMKASRFRKLDPATDLPTMTETSVPEVQS